MGQVVVNVSEELEAGADNSVPDLDLVPAVRSNHSNVRQNPRVGIWPPLASPRVAIFEFGVATLFFIKRYSFTGKEC